MDQRVPGQEAGNGMVRGIKPLKHPDLVPAVRVGHPSMVDELGNHVDPRRVDAELAKVVGDMPGTAAQIKHSAPLTRQVPPDEGEIVAVDLLAVTEQFDVE